MRIREVVITPVAFRDPPLLNASGCHQPWALRAIVLAPGFAARSVGIVLSDHHYWGGLRRSAELAAICRSWGVGVSTYTRTVDPAFDKRRPRW